MKYFIDTEFVFGIDTLGARITPISIGIVAEDGREFYAVDANWSYGWDVIPSFVQDVVVPVIPVPDHACYVHGTLETIARDIKAFIGDDPFPQWVGEYAAFDYVVLSTIMGGFEQWPEDWPMDIRDLMQESCPESVSATPHNALADARAVRDAYLWLHGEPGTDGGAG